MARNPEDLETGAEYRRRARSGETVESREPSSRFAPSSAWRVIRRRRRALAERSGDPPPRPERERRVFTDYVRALTSRTGQDQAAALVAEVWAALRRAAVSELRRRGMWEMPPVYLGFAGWPAWELPDGTAGALDELVSACYEASFVVRLGGLARHLEVKDNIDGLVFLNIKNLLHTLQLRHDPVGARVFEALRVAVRSLIDEGAVRVLGGSPEVLSDTVLGLAPGAEAASTTAAEDLGPRVASWSDELLPGLLTARGEGERGAVAEALAEKIRELSAAGCGAVRVQDLIDPLRTAVRGRWAAVLAHSEERLGIDSGGAAGSGRSGGDRDLEFGGLAGGYRPDRQTEAWDSFLKLTDCVAQALERLRARPATLGYLGRLWQYLRLYSLDPGDELPSQRALAALLEIPRNRLPGLYRVLGRVVEACRQATAAGLPVTDIQSEYGLELEGAS